MATCSREFTLNVTSHATLYYKLDALDGLAIDEVQDKDLTQSGAGAALVAGKINDAFQINASTNFSRDDASLMPDADSFTLRFWLNCPPGAFSNPILLIRPRTEPTFLEVLYSGSNVFIELTTDTGSFFRDSSIVGPLPVSTWHRVLLTYDHNSTLRLRINDGPDISTAANGDLLAGGTNNLFRVQGMNPNINLDEIYYSKGYVWTEQEIDNDWNGGAGRSWPQVP